MDSSPVITLPSDEELQTAVESENTYKDFKKKPKPKMRVIDTPKEELKYREKKTDVLEKEPLTCTTCGKDLKIHLSTNNSSCILSHPVLGVLLCKSCAEFYGEGEFSVDEDGTDKYCRWCGQGGTLYLCSECNFGFCRACIKRNLQRSILKDVQEDDWKCFACKPYPLWDLRSSCAAALKFIEENRKSKRRGSHSSKSRKSKISSSGSESEQVQKKADVRKKKKHGNSSDADLRKRKRSFSSPDESLGKKKKKRENSEETQGGKNEQNKHQYIKEVDRNTTLDIKAAETVATSCKEQIEYFLKFLRAMTSEVKKVLKEEIIVENLMEYAGRKKLLKKVMLLEEMSCQSVTQVCENFILGYRKSFASVTENNEQKDTNSGSEKESPTQKEECKPIENMEQQQNDDEIIEKPKTKYAKPSVHQFSESDNSEEELCQNDVNETEKNKSDSEYSKETLKHYSSDELVLDKSRNDNNGDLSSSECSKSKSDKNYSKKHKDGELSEEHVDGGEEIENNDQELQSDSDISSRVLPSKDACDDKQKVCEERSENGHLTSSKIVDLEEKGDQVSSKNNQKKLRNSDKTSNDLCEEKEIRNGEIESDVNDLVCDENEESNMNNKEEMQVSEELKTQQKTSKRKSVLESAEENSGSDDDGPSLTKNMEEKLKNSSGTSTEHVSNKENTDRKDETQLEDLNVLDENNLALSDGEKKTKCDR